MRALSVLAVLLWMTPSMACARSRSGPYAIDLIDENGERLPTYQHGGGTYVLGREGMRYSLRIRNRSSDRVEFVVSVDGRDALDGTPGNWNKRGYIVDAWDQVLIDGFRLDRESVAAFRFSSVRDSYAARMGDARDVGVIGVAVFSEQRRVLEAAPKMESRRQPSYDAPADSNGLGPGGLGTGLDNAMGGLRGAAGMGDAHGLGGLGSRGAGPGYGNIDLGGRGKGETRVVPGRTITEGVKEARRPEAAPSMKGGPKVVDAEERPGLGTEFGERRSSHVNEVEFERASSYPTAQLTLRYDDREGLLALGIDVEPRGRDREADRRENAQPFRENYCTPPAGWNR